MTRPLHPGRPNSRVLPADWQDQVSPVVSRAIADSGCTVTIRTPAGSSAWSDDAKRTVTTAGTTVYTGPATVTVMADTDRKVDVVDEEVATRLYVVQLPLDAPGNEAVANGQIITIDQNTDAALDSKTLVVQSVEWSSRLLSRVLYAVLDN